MHRRPATYGLALSALLLALAACAAEPRHDVRARSGLLVDPEQTRPRPPRVHMFVSPSGEPFRGDSGLAAWFAGADADHDGALTYAEFEADAMRFFKVLDANHDGVLDGFEIQAYERDRVPEIGADTFDDGPGPGRRTVAGGAGGRRRGGIGEGAQPITPPTPPAHQPRAGREGAARFGLLNEPQPVANADEDVDGRVSLTEWKHATQRRFARLDRAKTGKLILADLILPPDAKRPDAKAKAKP